MEELTDYCARFSPLDRAALADFLAATTTKTCKKGKQLLKKGQVCSYLYFVNAGLLKLSFTKNDKEFITRFFPENVLFSVFESFVPQTPTKLTLTALEDTKLTCIPYDALESLCARHHSVETLYRKLACLATAKMTNRIIDTLEGSSTGRYQQFLHDHAGITQRVSLGDIANYLGITQQSLSRLRASARFLPNGKKKSS